MSQAYHLVDDPMIQCQIPVFPPQYIALDSALLPTIMTGRRWFGECKTTHAECRIKHIFVPTRLVDVRLPDMSENVKLFEPRQSGIDNNSDLEYATLSHCWGETEHITTKSSTLGERKAGIAFSGLNQTFKDAVLVTRALELRYIWIDSLCIIQDSAEDWETESSLMGSIYGSGAINIAADAADDGDQGFLSKKLPLCFPYALSGKKELKGILYVKAAKRERWLEYSGNLRRRAWVFQEYNLSARSIRYGMNGLIWECRHGCYFDSEVIFEENQLRREARALKNFSLQVDSISLSSAASEISDIMTAWRKLVNEYSKKELTFEKDMLPALSGLASLVHAATGDQYLAGIWRSDLPEALQWVPEVPNWRSTSSLAPSWSWAASKKSCPIVYPSSRATQSEVRILDAGVVLFGKNQFGSVSDGFIKLEGLLKKVCLERSSADSLSWDIVCELGGRRIRPLVKYVVKGVDKITVPPPVWFLKLCVQSSQTFPGQRKEHNYHGILILEEDVKESVFRRLAYHTSLMSDADWNGAERKVIIMK